MKRPFAGVLALYCLVVGGVFLRELLHAVRAQGQATVADSLGDIGPPGPTGPTMSGTDTDVCFVDGSNAVCTDNGFQWDTTTKRLAVSDSGRNTMIGDGTGFAPDIGGGGLDNVLIGHLAGAEIDTAARDVVIGSGAAPHLNDQDENVVIGAGAGADMMAVNGDVVIGTNAGRGARTESTSGTQVDGSVIIGTRAGSSTGSDQQNVIIGGGALVALDSGGNTDAGSTNVIIGDLAAGKGARMAGAVLLGYRAAFSANAGLTHDIAIGTQAMENTPGGASDQGNIAIGYRALRNQDSSENGSIAIGETALQAQTDGGQNTAVGDGALKGNVHGFNNTAVGSGSGNNVGADQNTLVGFGSDVSGITIHDGTAVGQNAKANGHFAVAVGSGVTCAAGTVCLGDANVTGPLIVGATRRAVLCDLVGAPTCGTGCATVVANSGNCVGAVTTSTLAVSVTVNWSGTRAKAPFCTCTDNSVASFCAVTSVSTSSVTFGLSAGLTGTVTYHCLFES